MFSLLDSQEYDFFITENIYDVINSNVIDCKIQNIRVYDYVITNIGIFYKHINYDAIKDITHIKYIFGELSHKILSVPLINLIFLHLSPHINLNNLDLQLFPNLKTLVLNRTHLKKKILRNLPNNIETLIFERINAYCDCNLYNFEETINLTDNFAFDNLPTNLKKIIIQLNYGFTKKMYRNQRQYFLGHIKKFKIPSGCNVYFCVGDSKYHVCEEL